MFGATTNYPFNFANRNGIPMLESTSVEAKIIIAAVSVTKLNKMNVSSIIRNGRGNRNTMQ